jgi:uncharacterized protein YrzB (UPF0473 family)
VFKLPKNGHDHEHDSGIITLLDEEGQEHDFELINILEVDQNEYAVLLPPEDDTEDDAVEAIVLKRTEDEEGNEILVDIEDEEEWEKVAAAWEELMANTEFDDEE